MTAKFCNGMLLVAMAISLSGCGTTGPSNAKVSDFVSAVTASDGSRGSSQSGAPPAPNGGPAVTASSSGSVTSGGNDVIRLHAASPFQTVDVSVDGADGFFQVALAAPTTDVTLTASLGSSIPKSTYVAENRAASAAGSFGSPAAITNTVQPVGSGRGTLTATIDGVAFSGSTVGAFVQGGFVVTGDNANTGVVLSAFAPGGPGTFSFGSAGTLAGAEVIVGNAEWATVPGSTSGTLVLSTLTSTGASGTFSFTALPVPGTGATGTKTVANGTFNVTF
jgi:hypothetical protein